MRLILGIQPVREAIEVHGENLERVLIEKGDSRDLAALGRFASGRGAKVEWVTRGDLDRLAKKGARHQGVIAMAPELKLVELADIELGETPLILALDELEDPQNFGAVIRSAVALGTTAIIWPEHHSAPLTPATFRASAGAVEHATLCRVNSPTEALQTLREKGLTILGLEMSGTQHVADIDLRGGVVLVVGAEGKGLRKPVKAICHALVRLPMTGPIASLNASVAAGIALYEVVRQRASTASPTPAK